MSRDQDYCYLLLVQYVNVHCFDLLRKVSPTSSANEIFVAGTSSFASAAIKWSTVDDRWVLYAFLNYVYGTAIAITTLDSEYIFGVGFVT